MSTMPIEIAFVPTFVSTKEAAEIMGVTEARVRQLRIAGVLSAQQVDGRTWIISRADAERLAQRQTAVGRPRSGESKNPQNP